MTVLMSTNQFNYHLLKEISDYQGNKFKQESVKQDQQRQDLFYIKCEVNNQVWTRQRHLALQSQLKIEQCKYDSIYQSHKTSLQSEIKVSLSVIANSGQSSSKFVHTRNQGREPIMQKQDKKYWTNQQMCILCTLVKDNYTFEDIGEMIDRSTLACSKYYKKLTDKLVQFKMSAIQISKLLKLATQAPSCVIGTEFSKQFDNYSPLQIVEMLDALQFKYYDKLTKQQYDWASE
ncbi:Hypothetical_protein [Hexamita inflata]|uniref:Hypothetical_protein n=1 Tax=Hexamita inflata TaxID=28002 RepID=A0AA86PVN9_9EUKA|nr:Hypothetical protein HINF_LOCUS34865 [Hexamita inflata]